MLALDLGTTTAKAAFFDERGLAGAVLRCPLSLTFLKDGGVEQDPEDILSASRRLIARAAAALPRDARVAGVGLACQRSTIVVWERRNGRPIGPAVSWMDRRAAPLIRDLRTHSADVARRTGLRLSPHYGAAHLARRLRLEPSLARAARRGELAVGPVASFVLWHLTEGALCACDPTLAQRTLLLDRRRRRWDPWLCDLFGIPLSCLPEIRPSIGDWGTIALAGRPTPVAALAGDQQAAAAAFALDPPAAHRSILRVHERSGRTRVKIPTVTTRPRSQAGGTDVGRHKSPGGPQPPADDSAPRARAAHPAGGDGPISRPAVTGHPSRARAPRALVHYGTGAFALWPHARGQPRPGLLLSTRADPEGTFFHEGPVSTAGAALDVVARWIGRAKLRELLAGGGPAGTRECQDRFPHAKRSTAAEGSLRSRLSPDDALLVPAFAGLAAPWWDDEARAVLYGARSGDGAQELALAALAGIAHRIADVLETAGPTLPPHGAIVASGPLARMPVLVALQADLSGRPVHVAEEAEGTLRGIARLAARSLGVWEMAPIPTGAPLEPAIRASARAALRASWGRALDASRGRR